MTQSTDPAVPLSGQIQGQPRMVIAEYRGLEYAGEVVGLESSDAVWARSLEGDTYFRAVLLDDRGKVNLDEVQESRISVCILSQRASRRGPDVASELSAIRETQALYLTERGEGADLVRGYLPGQREDLDHQLVADEAARYAGGRLVASTVASKDLNWVFSGTEARDWYQRLAMALLSWAYPSSPVDYAMAGFTQVFLRVP